MIRNFRIINNTKNDVTIIEKNNTIIFKIEPNKNDSITPKIQNTEIEDKSNKTQSVEFDFTATAFYKDKKTGTEITEVKNGKGLIPKSKWDNFGITQT